MATTTGAIVWPGMAFAKPAYFIGRGCSLPADAVAAQYPEIQNKFTIA